MLLRVLRSLWPAVLSASDPDTRIDVASSGVDSFIAEGVVHHRSGDLEKAEEAYRRALKRNARNVDALHLLGLIAYRRGELDMAEVLVRDALAEHPDSGALLNTLAGVLTSMGRHAEAETSLKKALEKKPDALKARANLLFLLNIIPGISRERLLAEHVEWGVRHAPSTLQHGEHVAAGLGQQPLGVKARVRLGYISADFCSHPVGRIIAGVLRSHDRRSFEVFCYDNGSETDQLNRSLRLGAEHWVEIEKLDDEALAARIRSDRIQVLVDLSGHTRKHRLKTFALKPAPVQATWLGYLNTTGIAAMDWRITDLRADPPPQAQQWHVERLWYLPDCPWTWEPPSTQVAIDPILPCAKAGHVTFGSFNTFRKINNKVIEIWSQIMQRIPSARLRVYGAPRGTAVDRMYDAFESNGIDPARIDLFSPIDYERYLRAYGDIDISLDPFPYNGGATTCESLWMGVPVVTLAGNGGFSRSGASILGAMSLQWLVAKTQSEYVDIAVRLAEDYDGLAEMRGSLRQQFLSSPMSDTSTLTRNLERAYTEMWREGRTMSIALQGDQVSRV